MDKEDGRKDFACIDQTINPYAPYSEIFSKHIVAPLDNGDEEPESISVLLRILVGRQHDIVLVELQSDEDIFFYYECWVGQQEMKELNAQYGLEVRELAEFVVMLERMLLEFQEKKKNVRFEAAFDSSLVLNITTEINQNTYLALKLKFKKSSSGRVKELAAYRYGKLRQEIHDMEFHIADVKEKIRSKNPYLLHFINKN